MDALTRIRRNDAFLAQVLEVDDNTRALASQHLSSVLDALLDGTSPVLQVTRDEAGTHYGVSLRDSQALALVQRLALFLLEHQQRAALFLLATTALQLKDPKHPAMGSLLRACGQALRQARAPIPPDLLQALQGLACQCAQERGLSQEDFALFICDDKPRPSIHPGIDALLTQFGASDRQRQQVLDRETLCKALDTLLSGDPPALTVWKDGECLHCLVPPGDEPGEYVEPLVALAHGLQALRVPGAANLLAALSLAVPRQGDKETELIKSCGKALLLNGTHTLPHDVLRKLCARVGDLADQDLLEPDWLQTFEWVAKQHGAHDCLAALRLRVIERDLRQLRALGAPQMLVPALTSRIQALHRLMSDHHLDTAAAAALMQTLRQICGDGRDAGAVQPALDGLLHAQPS